MRRTLTAAMALLFAAGSPASAAMLVYSDDNDHKHVVNTWSTQSAVGERHSARIQPMNGITTGATDAAPRTRGFLLQSDDNDHKKVENGYAQ